MRVLKPDQASEWLIVKLSERYIIEKFARMIDFLFYAQCAVTSLLVVAMFFALLYYAIPFVEERVKTVARFGLIWSAATLALSLLIIPAGYGKAAFWSTFLTQCMWISVLSRDFPYISLFSLDLLFGALGTTISHGCWIWAFVYQSTSAFTALAYYLGFVWGVPIIVVMGMSVTDETSVRGRSRSIWAKLFEAVIGYVKSLVPGRKFA
jgi:hypothetical protein